MAVKTLKANFAINIVGALVPLAVALVTVPIYIHHIGVARYGVLSIVWVLLGYFGFLDLGLSRAAANALARLRDAPQPERARVLVTTLVLNLGLGLFGSLCLALVGGYLLQHVLAVPDALKPEIARAFPWIVGLFPLALVSGVGIGALESREKFVTANVLQVSGTSLGQIVPVILALAVSPSLAVVIPAAAIARALTVLAILIVVYREEGPLSAKAFDRSQVGSLLSYGGWVTVSSVVSPLLVSLDQFVIASMLGVTAVAYYAVPMNLITRSQFLPSALSRTLFPRMSSVQPQAARHLAARAITALAFSYGAICAPAMMLSPIFLEHWIGNSFSSVSSDTAVVLFIGAWVNGIAFTPYEMLQGQGRPDATGKFHLLEIIPFVGLLWLLAHFFGILGAATAWTIRVSADCLCLLWMADIRFSEIRGITLPGGLIATCATITLIFHPNPSVSFILAFLSGAVICFCTVAMSEEVRRVVAEFGGVRRGS